MVNCNKHLLVALGVLSNAKGEILLGRRPSGKSFAGLWEFPGGKIEAGETAFQALQREFLEEVNIHIHQADLLMQYVHQYPEKSIDFTVFNITAHSGKPQAMEQQALQWVSLNQLNQFDYPIAAYDILLKLGADVANCTRSDHVLSCSGV